MIYHDSWQYQFPTLLRFARETGCAPPTFWIAGVDSGTPTVIYYLSASTTQVLRLGTFLLLGCLKPGAAVPTTSTRRRFSPTISSFLGMFVLGASLFRNRLSAVYLYGATLFAGLCLQTLHSDQNVIILFWVPWILTCLVRVHRDERNAGFYLVLAALLIVVQSLDQSPHFVLIPAFWLSSSMRPCSRGNSGTPWCAIAWR